MSDAEFLIWLRARLVNVYKESENIDFVHRLDEVIERQKLLDALYKLIKAVVKP